MATFLIAYRADSPAFSTSTYLFETFDRTTGLSLASYLYASPPLDYPAQAQGLGGQLSTSWRVFTTALTIAGGTALRFAPDLTFLDATVITAPVVVAPPYVYPWPWFLADRTGRLFGIWSNSPGVGEIAHNTLVEFDPVTFDQTILWTDFQAEIGAGGRPLVRIGMVSADGTKLYYAIGATTDVTPTDAELGAVYVLDIPTGVASEFIPQYAPGYAPGSITQPFATGADGRVFVVWGAAGHIVVYESDGTVVLDLDTSATYQIAYVAPEPDGSAFWLMASAISDDHWDLNRYALPGGALELTNAITAGLDPIYYQLSMVDAPNAPEDFTPPLPPIPYPPGSPFPPPQTEGDGPQTYAMPMRKLRRSPTLSNEKFWLFFTRFQLDCHTGGAPIDLCLRYSDDAGNTWSDELWITVGALGVYDAVAEWWSLGRGRDRVWEVSSTSEALTVWLAAYLDIIPGTHG